MSWRTRSSAIFKEGDQSPDNNAPKAGDGNLKRNHGERAIPTGNWRERRQPEMIQATDWLHKSDNLSVANPATRSTENQIQAHDGMKPAARAEMLEPSWNLSSTNSAQKQAIKHEGMQPIPVEDLTSQENVSPICPEYSISHIKMQKGKLEEAEVSKFSATITASEQRFNASLHEQFPIDSRKMKSSPDFNTLKQELLQTISSNNLQDDDPDKPVPLDDKYIKAYCFAKEAEFRRVINHRVRGWSENKNTGDAFFKKQREQADSITMVNEKYFFDMMVRIAEDMHKKTGVLSPKVGATNIHVLDLCMAPGGFSDAAMRRNPRGKFFALTLPENLGGHPSLIPAEKFSGSVIKMDITLLRELTDKPIPREHPEYKKFSPVKPFTSYSFHLIFCDGIVLRTHDRPEYRQKNERMRLIYAQLILAMKRIHEKGGTIVILMHKIDSVTPARVSRACKMFSMFSEIEVYKPEKIHAARSSFYLIAKNVNTKLKEFTSTLKILQEEYHEATFGGREGTGQDFSLSREEDVLVLLETFGDELARLGRPIWKIQADALAKTNFAGGNLGEN